MFIFFSFFILCLLLICATFGEQRWIYNSSAVTAFCSCYSERMFHWSTLRNVILDSCTTPGTHCRILLRLESEVSRFEQRKRVCNDVPAVGFRLRRAESFWRFLELHAVGDCCFLQMAWSFLRCWQLRRVWGLYQRVLGQQRRLQLLSHVRHHRR